MSNGDVMVMMIGTAQLQKAVFIKKQDLQERTVRLIKMGKGKAREGENRMVEKSATVCLHNYYCRSFEVLFC